MKLYEDGNHIIRCGPNGIYFVSVEPPAPGIEDYVKVQRPADDVLPESNILPDRNQTQARLKWAKSVEWVGEGRRSNK